MDEASFVTTEMMTVMIKTIVTVVIFLSTQVSNLLLPYYKKYKISLVHLTEVCNALSKGMIYFVSVGIAVLSDKVF